MAHGDTRIIPLELQEALLPFRIEEFALREDSGGAGKFRGGLGFRKKYRILAPCNLRTNLDRTRCPPWGVQGGKQAKPGRFTRHQGRERRARSSDKENDYRLEAGRPCVRRDRRRRRLWSARASARSISSSAISMPAMCRRQAAERDYGVTIGADGKVRR